MLTSTPFTLFDIHIKRIDTGGNDISSAINPEVSA